MKIAVISDIHGNTYALNEVMNDIEAQGCEKIFVLGDYAMAGPDPVSVVQQFISLKENPKYSMIQGNTDKMIAEYSSDLYEMLKEKAPVMAEALKNDAKILGEKEKDFLKNLPAQLEIKEEGVTFLLVHGSPRKNNEDILPDTPMELLESMIENVGADVVLCGHTHIPVGFQTNSKKTVVNVGSVGRPFTNEPKSCYLIITVNNGECTFEHRLIEYDKESASEMLRNRTFNGAEKLAETLINPSKRHF